MTTTTTTPVGKSRPATSGAYLAASALYNAGFRGWPLVVMTALAGRESSWRPTALNNDAGTGDYSVGLWQINYFGNLLDGRTAEYGSPQVLLSNPQDQANAAYQLAGGNELVGLQNWALTPSPGQGVVPLGSTASTGKNTLAPFMAQALAAAGEVGSFGPAPASQIAQASTWPGSSALGGALTSGGDTSSAAATASATALLTAATATSGCSAKGNAFGEGGVAGIGKFEFTYCELKALIGGLTLAAGATIVVIGMATLIVGGLGSKGVGPVAPVIGAFSAVGAGARGAGRTAASPVRYAKSKRKPREPAPSTEEAA